jgi:hypothetical protein
MTITTGGVITTILAVWLSWQLIEISFLSLKAWDASGLLPAAILGFSLFLLLS